MSWINNLRNFSIKTKTTAPETKPEPAKEKGLNNIADSFERVRSSRTDFAAKNGIDGVRFEAMPKHAVIPSTVMQED